MYITNGKPNSLSNISALNARLWPPEMVAGWNAVRSDGWFRPDPEHELAECWTCYWKLKKTKCLVGVTHRQDDSQTPCTAAYPGRLFQREGDAAEKFLPVVSRARRWASITRCSHHGVARHVVNCQRDWSRNSRWHPVVCVRTAGICYRCLYPTFISATGNHRGQRVVWKIAEYIRGQAVSCESKGIAV